MLKIFNEKRIENHFKNPQNNHDSVRKRIRTEIRFMSGFSIEMNNRNGDKRKFMRFIVKREIGQKS